MNIKIIFLALLLSYSIQGESKEIFLPLKKNNLCYIFSSHTRKILSSFECEAIGKQSHFLIPVKLQGKWGYIDSKGNWVIKPQYDFADSFTEDVARVRKENLYGYINSKNQIIIPFQYYDAGNFSGNLAPVQCKQNYYGYINKNNVLVIPCRFQKSFEFQNEIARIFRNDVYGYITKSRFEPEIYYRYATDFGFHRAFVLTHRHKSFWLINEKQNFIKELSFNWIPFSFSKDVPLAVFLDLRTGWYGFLDRDGSVAIPPIFLIAEDFYLGYAKVKGPKTYIDSSGAYDYKDIYQNQNYEEFYISSDGKRITFFP